MWIEIVIMNFTFVFHDGKNMNKGLSFLSLYITYLYK